MKIKMTGLDKIMNKKIRIFKLDRAAIIKYFILSTPKQTNIYVLPSGSEPFAIRTNGAIEKKVLHVNIAESKYSYYRIIYTARHALVNNQLHVFGGMEGDRKVYFFINR